MSLLNKLASGNEGPIPGENFTSDTRNYPWHRAPEFSNVEQSMDHIVSVLSKPKSAYALTQMLELGLTVTEVTSVFLMKGVSKGKWSIDVGILLAGPVAHMIVILAKAGKIDYELGLDDEFDGPTTAYFNEVKNRSKAKDVTTEIEEVSETAKAKGFMAGETVPQSQSESLGE